MRPLHLITLMAVLSTMTVWAIVNHLGLDTCPPLFPTTGWPLGDWTPPTIRCTIDDPGVAFRALLHLLGRIGRH